MMLNLDCNYNSAVTTVSIAMPKTPTFVSSQEKPQRPPQFSQVEQVDHYSLLIDTDEVWSADLDEEMIEKSDYDNSDEIDQILDHT
jgi:hypothetical protein